MTQKELAFIELTEENIESMVHEIRGQKVMLDFDLARIYGYTTKAFNQQVQRNIEKFPGDFMFQLTHDEIEQISRSQNVTTKKSEIESEESLWCQNVTLKKSEIESEEISRSFFRPRCKLKELEVAVFIYRMLLPNKESTC